MGGGMETAERCCDCEREGSGESRIETELKCKDWATIVEYRVVNQSRRGETDVVEVAVRRM